MDGMNNATLPTPALAESSTSRADWTTILVVGIAHCTSHFFHLMLAPLFPWIKTEFGLSYAELGLVMTAFFVVSGIGQAVSGFAVDRFGARPVLFTSLSLFVVAALCASAATSYTWLVLASGLAGLGNAAFHPVDFSILNARMHKTRLGLAYSVHGITGNLGWALAPAFLGGLAVLFGWRAALWGAAFWAAMVLTVVVVFRDALDESALHQQAKAASNGGGAASVAQSSGANSGAFDFLKLPAVWFSFGFFLTYAIALGGVQSFGGEAARQLHDMPLSWGAMVLTLYMVASACGMVGGGLLVRNPERCEKVIGLGFGAAGVCALLVALTPVPPAGVLVLVLLMGFSVGLAGPSRDLLIKRAAPPNATGRVYGVVYSGLDVGMAIAPAVFGWMMDHGLPVWVWIGIALFQAVLIVSALRVGKSAKAQQALLAA